MHSSAAGAQRLSAVARCQGRRACAAAEIEYASLEWETPLFSPLLSDDDELSGLHSGSEGEVCRAAQRADSSLQTSATMAPLLYSLP